MEKAIGKEMPWEAQKAMLIEMNALKLPLLHQTLVKVYGDTKGREIYNDVFEENFKKRSARFADKDIGDLMMAEVDIFPAMGWNLWVEKQEEKSEPVWYEHLAKCPHLDVTRKYQLPDPCPLICDMDCIMGQKYNIAKWERLKHMPAGDSECCFRITRCK